jgi:hypothetical protein
MRARGLTFGEIGYLLGARRGTVRLWLQPQGTCSKCGGETSGPEVTRCHACVVWTRQKVIDALQAEFERTGRLPQMPRKAGSALPVPIAVNRLFGSWSAALEAAELRPCRCGCGQAVRDRRTNYVRGHHRT